MLGIRDHPESRRQLLDGIGEHVLQQAIIIRAFVDTTPAHKFNRIRQVAPMSPLRKGFSLNSASKTFGGRVPPGTSGKACMQLAEILDRAGVH